VAKRMLQTRFVCVVLPKSLRGPVCVVLPNMIKHALPIIWDVFPPDDQEDDIQVGESILRVLDLPGHGIKRCALAFNAGRHDDECRLLRV